MIVMIAFVHALVVVAVAHQCYRTQTLNQRVFWPALLLKLFAGCCLGLLYTFYYPVADTLGYFEDSVRIANIDLPSYITLLVFGNPPADLPLVMTEPRAFFFTRIVSLFTLLTNGNYWATGLYLSFLSFLGSWHLVQVISRNIPKVSTAAIVGFLFLPSAVLWSSGVLKESVAMAALFFLTALFLQVWFREKVGWRQVVLGILGFWLLWNLKYYYAGVFIAVACTTLLYQTIFAKRASSSAAREVWRWVMLLLVPAVLVTLLHPNFNIDRLLAVVVENNAAYHALSRSDNLVHFYQLEATPQSMLVNAPWALVSGLFRPFLWEVTSATQAIAALENVVILIFFITSLFGLKNSKISSYRLLVLSAVVYIVVLAVFLTLSAPNLGTLSRYRVGYLCFFTFIILCNNLLVPYVERSVGGLVNERKAV